MNIQTDLELSLSHLNTSNYSRENLLRIASEGTEEQRDTLLAWAWAHTSAALHEELCVAAGRDYDLLPFED